MNLRETDTTRAIPSNYPISWDSFYEIVEEKDAFYLYVTQDHCHTLPKRCFENRTHISAFRDHCIQGTKRHKGVFRISISPHSRLLALIMMPRSIGVLLLMLVGILASIIYGQLYAFL